MQSMQEDIKKLREEKEDNQQKINTIEQIQVMQSSQLVVLQEDNNSSGAKAEGKLH